MTSNERAFAGYDQWKTTDPRENDDCSGELVYNYVELAEAIGCGGEEQWSTVENTCERITQFLNKDNPGVSVQPCQVGVSPDYVDDWVLDFRRSIAGLLLTRAKRVQDCEWIAPNELPQEVLDYLDGYEMKHRLCVVTSPEARTVIGSKRYHVALGIRVPAPKVPGVVVSGTVEGVEGETGIHEMAFPIDVDLFWEVLDAVVEEQNEMWNETHGCADCAHDKQDEKVGVWAVDPDCPTCKGKGTAI